MWDWIPTQQCEYSSRSELTKMTTPDWEYSYDDVVYNDWHYAYDARGNLTHKEWQGETPSSAEYYWDAQNHLTKAYLEVDFAGTTTEFKYDAFGRRIAKKVDAGAWRKYFYDGLQVVAEGTGTADKIFYTHSPPAVGGIICREANGTKYWYHYDRLGNVVAVTDASGDPAALYTMDAFGNVLEVGRGNYYNEGADVQPYHLTTKEYDSDVGLYYFNARWYDQVTGIFLSKSVFPNYVEHSYVYCKGSPTNRTDPSGQCDILVDPLDWLADRLNPLAKAGRLCAMSVAAGNLIGATMARFDHHDGNGPKDAFFHCVISCEIEKACGCYGSSYWNSREEPEKSRSGQMDLTNNRVGQGIAMAGKDCGPGCRDALLNGELYCLKVVNEGGEAKVRVMPCYP